MVPSRFTTIKIAIGYALLLIVLLLGLFFIRREVKSISSSGQQQELLTDSLLQLLAEKDKSVLQLIQLMNTANEQSLSSLDIEKIVAEQDSVFSQQRVHKNIVAKHDTVIAQPPRKRFFRRIAEVFSPSKKDTSVIVNTTYEITVDTLIQAVNPADSLHQRILKANEESKKKRKLAAQRNSAYYKRLNKQLTTRIDSLMQSYETNIAQQANAMAEREQMIQARSTRILGSIALGAIILAILFIGISWRDLSRNNRYRKELEEANRKAEELLLTREKLMLAITHDIKAPLSSVMGYLDLLQCMEQPNEKSEMYIHHMQNASGHLMKLVTDLLDFHRLDLNKMEINRQSFNPVLLFNELKETFVPLVATKHLQFNVDIDPSLNGTYISDELRLRQVLTNLLSNAIKFTSHGSITLSAKYSSSTLTVQVSDTGVGMEQSQTKLIFQEFTRLPQAQGEEGFGLGLSIVHKLIHLLEGEIRVESTPGKGTAFTIIVPLYPVSGVQNKDYDEANPSVVSPNEILPLRILMIDDDKIQLSLTTEMLKRQGMEVTACLQINELLEALRNDHYDVLLTDVQMPSMNGFDLLRLLRSSNVGQSKQIPIIAITARSDMKVEEFTNKGFIGCLYKPFTVNEMIGLLSNIDKQPINEYTNNQPVNNQRGTLDLSKLIAFVEDDREASCALISTFIEETQKDLDAFELAYEQQNISGLSAIAHKLIPLFTLMGFDELVEKLIFMEKYKGDASFDKYHEITISIISLIKQSLNESQNYLKAI